MKNKAIVVLFLFAFLFSSCLDQSQTSSASEANLATANENTELKSGMTVVDKKNETKEEAEIKLDPSPKEQPKQEQDNKTEEADKAEKQKQASEKKKKRSSRKPRISFESSTYEFGSITQGEEITHKFQFKNTGQKDLLITNVTATCGCTQPSFPFIPIAPGESGFIGVSYNSTGKLGPQKPSLTVTTNATPKTYKLYLSGVVDAAKSDERTAEKKSDKL